MAQNPFKENQGFSNKPNRNSFDLSHTNNLTCNFGTLYPVLNLPVVPGDSFHCDAAFALRFMPLPFPVQTRCRAYIHFFYQRNKNVWKNWQDFQSENKPHVNPRKALESGFTQPAGSVIPPFIIHDKSNDPTFHTGSLGDYLGLPTSRVVSNSSTSGQSFPRLSVSNNGTELPFNQCFQLVVRKSSNSPGLFHVKFGDFKNAADFESIYTNKGFNFIVPSSSSSFLSFPNNTNYYSSVVYPLRESSTADGIHGGVGINLSFKYPWNYGFVNNKKFPVVAILSSDNYPDEVYDCEYDGEGHIFLTIQTLRHSGFYSNAKLVLVLPLAAPSPIANADSWNIPIQIMTYSHCDWTIPTGFPINALPFRVYDSIYNSFYRDERTNPLMINGVQEFNKYVHNDGDGLDDFPYHLYNRNWELDQFTSCVPSPQQGVAPLVGLSENGDLVTYSSDGDEQLVAKLNSDAELDSVEVKNAIRSLSSSLESITSAGISINDFRNVSAYQRWKETNIRRGLKYKDQIKARWGVDLKESLLDMPEFIGGISCEVDVNTVSSTTQNENAPLGAYAGQMTAFGRNENHISQYCDDYGYIMAILCVVPTPVYTSVLDKDFTKFSPLDYYSPEFGQIGMQPVPYHELVAIDSLDINLSGTVSDQTNIPFGSETFGYQRPWYDYLSKLDSAHGLFRTELSRFILKRELFGKPLLSPEFTTINHNELTDIFTTSYGDKILGQIRFKIEMKRPIPKISVPSLN